MKIQSNWNEDRAKNWNLFMPPARPSNEEMVEYEKIVSQGNKINHATWGLLGVTPEVRSLAARYNQELICIDRNERVFEILRSLVAPQNPYEFFICSDWFEADLSKQTGPPLTSLSGIVQSICFHWIFMRNY